MGVERASDLLKDVVAFFLRKGHGRGTLLTAGVVEIYFPKGR